MAKNIKSLKILFFIPMWVFLMFVIINCNNNDANSQVDSIPKNKATAISFTDSDIKKDRLKGTITITKAENESDITHYILYWGIDSETKMEPPIILIEKTGSDLSYEFVENSIVPDDASHFLVYTINGFGEMSAGIGNAVNDYFRYPVDTWDVETPEAHALDPDKLQAAADWAEYNGSHSLLVIRNGAVVLEQYWNGYDDETPQQVFSVTKSFTSVITGIAEDHGYLDIDGYAYDYNIAWGGTDSEEIKIINLLSNNSGRYWEYSADYLTPITVMAGGGDLTEYALGLGQQYDPGPVPVGTVFQYNNMAIQCLERVLSTALNNNSAGTLQDFTQDYLLDPLGMGNTTLLSDNLGNMAVCFGIGSTARDLARLGWLMFNDGKWKEERIVSREYVERAISPAEPDLFKSYGLLFWLNGDGTYWNDLPADAYVAIGMFGQLIIVLPSDNMIIIRQGQAGGYFDGSDYNYLINGLYYRVFNTVSDVFIQPVLLTAPDNNAVNTGDTPTFTWQDYTINAWPGTPPGVWSYVIYAIPTSSGAPLPPIIWGLPNNITILDMASLPPGKNKYDIVCLANGGAWDGSTCSGASGSLADLSSETEWFWKVMVVECDYDKFINDDPASAPGDDYSACIAAILGVGGDGYANSEVIRLMTTP